MPALIPQPQSITALLAGTHFTVPRRVEGWVDLGGWLYTEIKCRLRESNPDTSIQVLTGLVDTTNTVTTSPRRQPGTRVII